MRPFRDPRDESAFFYIALAKKGLSGPVDGGFLNLYRTSRLPSRYGGAPPDIAAPFKDSSLDYYSVSFLLLEY